LKNLSLKVKGEIHVVLCQYGNVIVLRSTADFPMFRCADRQGRGVAILAYRPRPNVHHALFHVREGNLTEGAVGNHGRRLISPYIYKDLTAFGFPKNKREILLSRM